MPESRSLHPVNPVILSNKGRAGRTRWLWATRFAVMDTLSRLQAGAPDVGRSWTGWTGWTGWGGTRMGLRLL